MDNQLQNSLCYPDPQVDFKPLIGLKPQMEATKYLKLLDHRHNQNQKIMIDFGGP
jgi:hypothetical protein